MILEKGHSKQYLEDWQDGLIKQGLGIGCELTDQHIRYKQGQVNFIMGLDNVGKTHWELWYYLVLAVQHGITFDLWTGENNPNQSVKKLIEMLAGRKIEKMQRHELYNYHDQIGQWFNFLSNSKMYKSKDMLDVFAGTNSNACLIDPFTGLDRSYGHADNYEFLNSGRDFTNKTGKTLYVSLHPRTEAGSREYPKGHDLEGFVKPPSKSHSEGGQAFPNRADDFFILHRLTQHPTYRLKTQLHVAKVKDTDTGGGPTLADAPIMYDYNYGLGFLINGYNPLKAKPKPPEPKQTTLLPNKDFDINKTIEGKGKVYDFPDTNEEETFK